MKNLPINFINKAKVYIPNDKVYENIKHVTIDAKDVYYLINNYHDQNYKRISTTPEYVDGTIHINYTNDNNLDTLAIMNKLTINPNDFIIKDIQEHRFYISKYHFREYSTSIKEFTEDEIKDGYIPVEFTSDLDISQDFTHVTNTTINAIIFNEQFGTKKLITTYINKSIDLPTDETIDEILTKHKYETDNDIKNGPFGYGDYYSYKVPTNTTCNFLALKNDLSKLIDNENKKVDNETTTNLQLESYIQLSTDKVIRELTEINNDNNRKVIEVLSDFYKDLKNEIYENRNLINRSNTNIDITSIMSKLNTIIDNSNYIIKRI